MISEVLAKKPFAPRSTFPNPDGYAWSYYMTLSPLAKGFYPYLNVSALRSDNNTGLDLGIDIW